MIKYSHLELIKLKKINLIKFLINNKIPSKIKYLWLIKLLCLLNKYNNNNPIRILNLSNNNLDQHNLPNLHQKNNKNNNLFLPNQS
jgi:hypothetical protein